jgi:DNA-directed RNA polymerase subunit RPC12/RpoP
VPSPAKFGKYTPPGRRKGVRRGNSPSGALTYNGHRHVSETTKAAVLKFMTGLGRPTTPPEVAAALGYSNGYLRNLLAALRDDGVVVRLGKQCKGSPAIYQMPFAGAYGGEDWTGEKQACTRCGDVLPLDAFQRDRSQRSGRHSRCRNCRSRRIHRAVTRDA